MNLFTAFSSILIPCALFATSDRIIFHHIPKTGGITFRSIIESQIPKE